MGKEMNEKIGKKVVAGFELTLMLVSLFAFSYIVHGSEGGFEELNKLRAERDRQIAEINSEVQVVEVSFFRRVVSSIYDRLKSPMIPVVSATQVNTTLKDGSVLTEETVRTTFDISSESFGAGCCSVTLDGQKCATTVPEECQPNVVFAEGALCSQTSFCQKGCCYDEEMGIFDRNALKVDCSASWVNDPNCNMPAAALGCCVLGTNTIFETEGQCRVDTLARALGPDAVFDWRANVNEGACLSLSASQEEGACVVGDSCMFLTEVDCLSYQGQFSKDYLCTSPEIGEFCEMTDQTTCVSGKDGVYFLDSCGNPANIYDSSKVNDPTYWNRVVSAEELCGVDDVKGGNADSSDCGNCNRFLGGICGSAVEDNFKVDSGEFYCRDTSCMYNGVNYKNGESWCVYDGAIGEGNDVVGSRHWKYVCSQGVVAIEPCADYRNQICAQTNTFDVEGEAVDFRNAACVANNWRKCIDLNSQEDGLEKCEETLNCRLENIAAADKFNFNVCVPKYPGGFSLNNERYMETAEKLCRMADQTCTVVNAPKKWGGCEIVANEGCLSPIFAQEMNDFCRSLGDCGGAVNIEGVYSENYKVKGSGMLSSKAVNSLMELAKPVSGQYAPFEDYSEYLAAAGLSGRPEDAGVAGEAEEVFDIGGVSKGFIGVGYAVGVSAILLSGGAFGLKAAFTLSALPGTGAGAPSALAGNVFAPFAGAAIGAGIGMIAGSMLASYIGLNPGGAMLMSIGGGLVGGSLGLALVNPALWNPVLFWVGITLIVVSLFFGGSDCENIEVQFECKPWRAPTGGDDCEKCNEDPLKPCSEYRCNSLGAACELVNKGTNQELCASSKDDGKAPVLSPQLTVISSNEIYSDVNSEGFGLTSVSGGCIDAYTPLTFGIQTSELAHCKFDVEAKDFAEMDYDLGGNAYLYNHTTTFVLPDPSHGQSQGADWTGDLNLYIKCEDTHGHINPSFYTVDLCVVEGPDKTAPKIAGTEPTNNAIVGFNVSSKKISLVTNELSSCKWALSDKSYSEMANSFECVDEYGRPSNPLGYLCSGEVPTANSSNVYYIRCADQPWLDGLDRGDECNANQESFVYNLRKPDKKIEIDSLEPSEDFETNTKMTTVDLTVRTSGGGVYHKCSYSFSGYDNMIEMFETGFDKTHIQPLNRPAGRDKIYIECSDETGDSSRGTIEFRIIYDVSTPQVARIWQVGEMMHIITTEPSECVYTTKSCSYNWADGISAGSGEEHTISVSSGNVYYIKCKDEFGNVPSDCSIPAQAV